MVFQVVRKCRKKASLLEKRNVAPEGSGVVELSATLRRHLFTGREGGHLPKFAKIGVSSDGGCRPRKGSIRLFHQVGMGGVLHVAVHLARKNIGWAEEANPLGGPHLGKGTGRMELLLRAHGNLAGDGKLRRAPTDCQGEAVLSEELVGRDEMFAGRRKGIECCARRRPHIPESHRKGGGRRHGLQLRKADISQVGRHGGNQRRRAVAIRPGDGPMGNAFPSGVDGKANAIHSIRVGIRKNTNTLPA